MLDALAVEPGQRILEIGTGTGYNAALRYLTRQTGPRKLWDQAAAAYRWWQQHGEPGIEDWRWTIQPHRQRISLT